MTPPEVFRPSTRLLALLCNPPLGEVASTTTAKSLRVLQGLLGANDLEICNLIAHPTTNTRSIPPDAIPDLDAWRRELHDVASRSDMVLAAWGTFPPRGWPKAPWVNLEQVTYDTLRSSGHARVLQVGGSPRHPSRWRQHTSPIHQRYAGDTFERRLSSALGWRPLT